MNLKVMALHALAVTFLAASMGSNALAQAPEKAESNIAASSATRVSAEMTEGKLNPSESKPGDKVALKLKEDVRSNGEVVLKKGTTINGVVKSVKQTEGKAQASGQAQSMMEIEWLAPAASGKASQQLSIALQSVAQVSPMQRQREAEESGAPDFGVGSSASTAARSGGSLGGGLLGTAGGAVGGVVNASGGLASSTTGAVSGTSNVALMSMPSVVAADSQTTSSLAGTFGMSSSSQLYKLGRGEVVSSGGTRHSMDIFSHMSNDTVITSPSRNFEISSGAQMQLLVGVRK